MKLKKDYKEFIKEHREELSLFFGELLTFYRDEALNMDCKTSEDIVLRDRKIESYRFIKDALFKMKMITNNKQQEVDKFI